MFFLSSRRRHTRCALVTGVQTCALPISHRGDPATAVEPEHLVNLAQACRRQERLRFGYIDGEGNTSDRHVEPYQLVHTSRRWYLVARDRDKGERKSVV